MLPGARWELEVPRGTDEVAVSVGDPPYPSRNTLAVEGEEFCRDIALPGGVKLIARKVDVRDGRLTLETPAGGERLAKINSVTLRSL